MRYFLQPPAQQRLSNKSYRLHERSKMLEQRQHAAVDKFFAQYRACVFSNRNAPGSAELRESMDLSLEELRGQGQGRDIFPPRAFFALRSALPMGHFLPR
jgi:hypothetical protein